MEQTIQSKFIPQQLLNFIAGRRCCQVFSCSFPIRDHNAILDSARGFLLRSRLVLNDGEECVKVFKPSCKHYLDEPMSLTLSHPTSANLLMLLAHTGATEKDNEHKNEYFFGVRSAVEVSSHHIFLTDQSPQIYRNNTFIIDTSGYNEMLGFIHNNRVTIFDGDASMDKALFFPLTILKDTQYKQNVKIVCVEKDSIFAIYNSKRFAECLHVNIGETVGIQVPQYNCISSVSNVVYTTAEYYLRCCMNKDSSEVKQITHFVVNDVDLHSPYTDILLYELKKTLILDNRVRIVLLSHASEVSRFVNYFGTDIQIHMQSVHAFSANISYLEDIQDLIDLQYIPKGREVYKNQRQMFRNKSLRNEQIDKCLQVYEQRGSDVAIRPLLYAINYELVPVNYQHSFTGKTAVFIAAQLGKSNHLRLFLYMGADPNILDENHQNALTVATLNGHNECVNILQNFKLQGNLAKKDKPQFVDYDLIIDLISFIVTSNHFSPGNILVILPTYYHLVKLNYMLLSNYLTDSLREFSIFMLHKDMDREYLYSLKECSNETVKVVLATDIVETLVLPISFKYLIDTACQKQSVYDVCSSSTEDLYEWVSKECLTRRSSILKAGGGGAEKHCFRLISRKTYETLNESEQPAVQRMHLDKICLTAKLLSPHTSISEYLTNLVAPPAILAIHQTVEFLKKIEVLDDAEAVTFLGARLIDIPIPCQLGRTLVFGILLQCLDPILTIVSSLLTADPLSLPFSEDIDSLWERFTIYIQSCVKNERVRLAENQFSDHLISVRLFQEWQARFKNEIYPLYLTDEYTFVLNGLMERLNQTRIQIVSALRITALVHSTGALSIQSLNLNSDNWPLVKAALTGGMYPNICAVQLERRCFSSAHSSSISLHANSVLRNFFEPFQDAAQRMCTSWIVCTKQKNHIKYGTAVVPLAVAMFCGSSDLGLEHPVVLPSPSAENSVQFFIDEWIWMVVSKTDYELVMKARHKFYRIYEYFLEHCSHMDRWSNESLHRLQQKELLFTLTTIFKEEDAVAGFKKCFNIGYRPSLKLPNLYLLNLNTHFTCQQDAAESKDIRLVEKHFFLVHTEESPMKFYLNADSNFLESLFGNFVGSNESPNKRFYVILYSKDIGAVLSIGRLQNDFCVLKEYFRNSIPLKEVILSCASWNVKVPRFDGHFPLVLVEKRAGELIMNLFAYRHHWVHK